MNKRQKKKLKKRGLCFHYKEFKLLYKDFCNVDDPVIYDISIENFAKLKCISEYANKCERNTTHDFQTFAEINQRLKIYHRYRY